MRPLRAILLVNLGILTGAALILVGGSALLSSSVEGPEATYLVLAYGAGALLLILGLEAWLVRRTVLRPLTALARIADLLQGDGIAPALDRPFEAKEFAGLESGLRVLAQRLHDAQDQVVRIERLATVGRLSAGLAHELRGPLGALNTHLEALSRRGADTDVVEAMRNEVARMDRFTAGWPDRSDPRATTHAPSDLAAVARATVELLTRQGALKGNSVELVADPDAPTVAADPHDLRQILVNLILNARDAAPGSRIVIGVHRHAPGARQRHSDETTILARPRRRDALPPPRPVPGGGTLLIVADEGPGVPEADRERIFDPFVTTKAAAAGTGLGLALVARAAQDAGGAAWVDRAREGGAVFKVLFPASGPGR